MKDIHRSQESSQTSVEMYLANLPHPGHILHLTPFPSNELNFPQPNCHLQKECLTLMTWSWKGLHQKYDQRDLQRRESVEMNVLHY